MRHANAWVFRIRSRTSWLAGLACFAVCGVSLAAELPIKTGQKVVFVGDSVTACGVAPAGWVSLTTAGLKANGVEVKGIGLGASGATSKNLVSYNVPVALGYKPDWMVVSIGLNDQKEELRGQGMTLDQYKTNLTTIVEKAQAANVKVMILTTTVNGEDLDNKFNQGLLTYNDFLRALAKEKKCLLAHLNPVFREVLKTSPKPKSGFL